MKALAPLWKPISQSAASEGLWEENIQTAIQQYEGQFARNITDDPMAQEIAENMLVNMKGFAKSFIPGTTNSAAEDEGAVSIFLGGLIGGIFGARAGLMEKNEVDAIIKTEKKRFDHIFNTLAPSAFKQLMENKKAILKVVGTQEIEIEGKKVTVPVYERTKDKNGREF
jgi:hypothetical protein